MLQWYQSIFSLSLGFCSGYFEIIHWYRLNCQPNVEAISQVRIYHNTKEKNF